MRFPIPRFPIPRFPIPGLLAALVGFGVPRPVHPDDAVTIEPAGGGRYEVKLGGRLFTTLHTEEFPKPILYPVIGPGGVRLTRDYPMKKDTAGEAKDHPHQQSLWFTHGDVNGVDFWSLGKGRVVTEEVRQVASGGPRARIVLKDRWVEPGGKTLCTDEQELTFHAGEAPGGSGAIALDYVVTLHASEGDVTFGDTKEGTLGIRTHPALQIDKGAGAVNSEGVTGKAIWGKRARWVGYSAEIEGKKVGIAVLDHPSNPRHPTWWHAREYGLVAANPFGVHDFEKKEPGAGDLKLEAGRSLTFRYRFLFHEGGPEEAGIERRWAEWVDPPRSPGLPARAAGAPGDGSVSLFDGKTLEGWVERGGKAEYRVEDGAIVGRTVPDTPNSFLVTAREYGDFVLEYEFLCDARLNSGVQIRSAALAEPREYSSGGKTLRVPAGRVHGYQVEIDPDKPERMWAGGIYDEGRRGWLFPGERGGDPAAFTAAGKRLYKPGDWNHVRVEARGARIRTWLNGEPRADFECDMTPRGFIALQVHGVGGRKEPLEVRWRRLRIRDPEGSF
jgi:hypothetical protein